MDKKYLKWVLLAAGSALCSVGLLILYKNKPQSLLEGKREEVK